MEFLEHFRFLYDGVAYFFKSNPVLTEDGVQMVPGWKYLVMFLIGGVLIYLALVKDFEPALLMPMGFGAILVNIPFSGAVGAAEDGSLGIIDWLFNVAMIDFGPLLSNPKMFLFGAAAQFGIFFTVLVASFFFPFKDAAAIGIIGAADGPTSILVSRIFDSQYIGAIAVAAYSYMALVPIIQPAAIKLVTTKKERQIRMPYNPQSVSRKTRILFPIIVTIIAGLVAPKSVSLVGMLMFGNLLRECLKLESLSQTAQTTLANLITIVLGLTIASSMKAYKFVDPATLLIMALGLVAFVFDTIGGVLFAKLMNLFLPQGKKINPMVGGAGISAFPMSARVIQKMALKEDNQNHLLMHAVGANVAGQIGSVVAGGIILTVVPRLIGA